MFKDLAYINYDGHQKINFYIYDDCGCSGEASTPPGAPQLNIKTYMGNSLIALTIIKYYENKNRNVAKNLANYYQYLISKGFYIDDYFIERQLRHIDKSLKVNIYYKKYFYSVCRYLQNVGIVSSICYDFNH